MRPIILFLVLAGAGIITWLVLARPAAKKVEPKQQALAMSKHSAAFNQSVAAMLTDYEKLSEQFVTWDSVNAAATAQVVSKELENIPLEELKKDASGIHETAAAFVENAKGDLETIATEKAIRTQREAFNNLTDNIEQFLNAIKYDSEKLFVQQCPMAFDDVVSAKWLSRNEEIRNPYLGLHDPKYGKGMLVCGETIKTINHTGNQ